MGIQINIVQLSQIIGTFSVLLLFIVQFYVSVITKAFHKAGRTTLLWTSIYVLFLFLLRFIQLFHIGTLDQLRVISGFTSLIPLVATLIQLFLMRKMGDEVV